MRTLVQVIDAIKKMKGLSTDAEVASLLGLKPQTLATAKSRNSMPYDKLITFCDDEACSLDFLLRGVEWQEEAPYHRIKEPDAVMEPDYIMLPLVESEVAAGLSGTVPNDSIKDKYPFKRSWIRKAAGGAGRDFISRLVLIRARGQSMQPTINDGELMLVNLRDRHEIINDHIYIMRSQDGGITVKRLVTVLEGILCLSDNKAFKAFLIKLRPGEPLDAHVLGRVYWVGRELVS